MSNNNNEASTAIGAGVFLGIGAIVWIGLLVVAIAAFMTLLAVLTHIKPVRWQGALITPKAGRRFIMWGLIGTIPVSMLIVQLFVWINYPVQPDWVWLVLLFGYSISAIGIEALREAIWPDDEPDALYGPVTGNYVLPSDRRISEDAQFAKWYDESTR